MFARMNNPHVERVHVDVPENNERVDNNQMKNQIDFMRNKLYLKTSKGNFQQNPKAVEKYILAKEFNPLRTKESIKAQNDEILRNIKEHKDYLTRSGNDPNLVGNLSSVESALRHDKLNKERLYHDRTERNRKKAIKLIQSGEFFKPTKCSDCGVVFPNKSAYMHHKDNNMDLDGIHKSSYTKKKEYLDSLSENERSEYLAKEKEREKNMAFAMLYGSLGIDHPDIAHAHAMATKKVLGLQ